MLDVLIALLPATIASVIIFGLQAFILVVVCTASAVLAEWGFQALCKQKLLFLICLLQSRVFYWL